MRIISILASLVLSGIVSAQTPQPVEPGGGGGSGGGGSGGGGGGGGQPVPIPAPVPTADVVIDTISESYIETGVWDFGAAPVVMLAAPPIYCLAENPMGYAVQVLKFVHSHRLGESGDITDQMVLDLIAADPVVAQQYATLVNSGSLTTDGAVDLTAMLSHAALVRNYGAGGTVIGQGSILSSGPLGGPWCSPPTCLNDLGGIIWWGNYWRQPLCQPNGCYRFQEAMVFLTIVKPDGTIYRAVTNSRPCTCHTAGGGQNTTSGYAFAGVPQGSATVVARSVFECCKSGTTVRAVTCPPGPRSYRPCVPIAPTVVADVQMGPPTPPGVCGRVSNPGPGATRVFFGPRETSCTDYGGTSVTQSNPNFLVRSCLPSQSYIYANNGTRWAEADIPDTLACGEVWPSMCELTLTLTDCPCFSGSVSNWQACMHGHYFVLFEGCTMYGCNSAGSRRVRVGVQANGAFNSGTQLQPGTWNAWLIYVPNLQFPDTFLYSGTFSGQWPKRLAAGDNCQSLGSVIPVVRCP
ncbi:MAG: hypothetical protein H7210_10380 [Pyrinomonadaceae bacterium]|nr:hypothetical protein [Phycisphaerales bacterium]